MKKIEALIRPEKLDEMKDILEKLNLNGLTVSQVMGCGNQKGWREFIRGAEVDYNFLPKVKLELVVRDEQLDEAVNAIVEKARTGEAGDGKIFISSIDEAVRIRTGEKGDAALR